MASSVRSTLNSHGASEGLVITAQALLMMTDDTHRKRAAEFTKGALRGEPGTYEVKCLITSLSSRLGVLGLWSQHRTSMHRLSDRGAGINAGSGGQPHF